MNSREQKMEAFGRLLDIMDDLREKCPWDKKQTLQTLRTLTIEETYELSEAILENNLSEIKKELGDVMLHLVFYAKIASEGQFFDIADVLHSICDKLVERHPHIYGDVVVENEQEVKKNWEKIKIKTGNESVLSGVPKSLPAMVKAMRIQEKAAGIGFDWDKRTEVFEKIKEELTELEQELANNHQENIEKEFGDVLFSLVNYARFIKVNPETALEYTNSKFIKRFQFVEQKAKELEKNISEMSLKEMDNLWELAKKQL